MSNLEMFSNAGDYVIDLIIKSPFIESMLRGDLSREVFALFIVQDTLYLKEYIKLNEKLIDLITDEEARGFFFSQIKGLSQELEFLQTKFNHEISSFPKDSEQNPSNLLYTSYMHKVVSEKNEVKALCALFACPWVYFKIGKYLKENVRCDNPYFEWIDSYSYEGYIQSIENFGNYIAKLLLGLNDFEKNEALKCFIQTCKMEYLFWDAAYKNENWPGDFALFPKINLENPKPRVAITIAGSDSSGGAGIQADLNTFSSHKVFGTSAITVLTAQNSIGVQSVFPIDTKFVESQLKSVFSDLEVNAIKVGMLYDISIITEVAEFFQRLKLEKLKVAPIVIDPVFISTSGHLLIKEEAIDCLATKLFPLAEIITPNLDETKKLLNLIHSDLEIDSVDKMKEAAKLIASHYNIKSILVKGGHLNLNSKAVDVLYNNRTDTYQIYQADYLKSENTHGTGCSLSSSIAANLAKGFQLEQAVEHAKLYVYQAILNGFRVGQGKNGTLNHFHKK